MDIFPGSLNSWRDILFPIIGWSREDRIDGFWYVCRKQTCWNTVEIADLNRDDVRKITSGSVSWEAHDEFSLAHTLEGVVQHVKTLCRHPVPECRYLLIARIITGRRLQFIPSNFECWLGHNLWFHHHCSSHMIIRQQEQIHLRENLSRTMQAVLFWRTPIDLAKRFAKPIVGLKPVFQGNIDDPFPLSKLYNSIGQASSSDILHDGFANIRMKHAGVMIGRETSNACQCFRHQIFFQVFFNVINTRLDTSAIVHGIPLPDR